jgi:hypothetical protein
MPRVHDDTTPLDDGVEIRGAPRLMRLFRDWRSGIAVGCLRHQRGVRDA